MPFYKGIPANAEIEYMIVDEPQYSVNGGAVGNADAYFEHNERIIRKMLSEDLGVEFFRGHGDID